MRLAVIAPSLALRTGLAALVAGRPGDSNSAFAGEIEISAVVGRPEVLRLEDADAWLITGSLFDADSLPGGAEGQPALLVLYDGLPEDAPILIERLRQAHLPAWGVLPLEAEQDELLAALAGLAAGLICLHPAYAAGVRAGPRREAENDAGAAALTGREQQVLQLLAAGRANKQIALALGISEHTVKFHIASIYNKLGVSNRAEAVRAAVKGGWVFI